MRRAITVSIPEGIKKELDRVTREEGVTLSDIVRESLRSYLFEREFRRLRRRLMAKAAARGSYTDEDVFELIS